MFFLFIKNFFKSVINKKWDFSIFFKALFSQRKKILLILNEFENLFRRLCFNKVLFNIFNNHFQFVFKWFKGIIFEFESEIPEDFEWFFIIVLNHRFQQLIKNEIIVLFDELFFKIINSILLRLKYFVKISLSLQVLINYGQ